DEDVRHDGARDVAVEQRQFRSRRLPDDEQERREPRERDHEPGQRVEEGGALDFHVPLDREALEVDREGGSYAWSDALTSQLARLRAVYVHRPDLHAARAGALKREPISVGEPRRNLVDARPGALAKAADRLRTKVQNPYASSLSLRGSLERDLR